MWVYEGKPLDIIPENCYGYVYQIEHISTGKKYIGRKYFTQAGQKRVKGKVKKIRKESNWKDYYGSSKSLLEDIKIHGKAAFKRNILALCSTRGECNYLEAKYQFDQDVLRSPEFYNDWISIKIHRASVPTNKKDHTCIPSTQNQTVKNVSKRKPSSAKKISRSPKS